MPNPPIDPDDNASVIEDPGVPVSDSPLALLEPAPLPVITAEDLAPPYSAFPPVSLDLYPDEPYAYGLGIRHVQPYAYFVLERWHTWAIFDAFELYLNNDLLADGLVLDDQDRFGLYVIAERVPEGEVQVRARVLRAGSGQESTSPTQSILIKTTRPGGIENNGDDKWHSKLRLRVDGLPESSTINMDTISRGLYAEIESYPNRRKNDTIEFYWDGVEVKHLVTAAEAAGIQPLRVFISKENILKGGLSGVLTLRFKVFDVVQNYSGEKYQYSRPYALIAELDPSLMSAPRFLVDDSESRQIDYDTQSNSLFEILLQTPRVDPNPLPANQVTITLTATLADGTIEQLVLDPVNVRNGREEIFPVDRDLIERVIGGSFRVSFVWHTATGGHLGQSGSVTVTVVGTPTSMPAVTVTPSELGLINPDDDAFISIPSYQPHAYDSMETLIIEQIVPGGGGMRYSDPQLAGDQGGTRRVTSEVLQRFEGLGDVAVYYLVDDGADAQLHAYGALIERKSRVLTVRVDKRLETMPAPTLEGAIDGNVDPVDVVGDTVLLTLPYTLTKSRDHIQWNIVGTGTGGSASGTSTINGATQGQPLVLQVSRAVLDNNFDGQLRITYSLQRENPLPKLTLRSFTTLLTVGRGVELDAPEVVEAERYPDRLDPLAAQSGATVLVKYRRMRESESFSVKWVTADLLGSTVETGWGNPDTNEVRVPIEARTIAKGIRNERNRISVQYTFTRSGFLHESDILNLDLLPLSGLPTPTIDGVGNSVILPTNELIAQARTRVTVWPLANEWQNMWLDYTSTNADDSPFYLETLIAAPVGESATQGVSQPIPLAELQGLRNGAHLTIRFWVSLAESTDKNTAVLFGVREHIIQSIPATLPRPAFANLQGATLTIDPQDWQNNAYVAVAYNEMTAAHSIALEWIYPDGTMATIPAQNGNTSKRVDFQISRDILANSVGKLIELRYMATIGTTTVPSEIQALTVNRVPSSALPRPLINGVPTGGQLNLNTFSTNATLSVAPHPLAATGQKFWVVLAMPGSAPLYVLTNYSLLAEEVSTGLVNKAVLRTWLDGLPNNSTIFVTCKVTFDGSSVESTAITFPTAMYTVITSLRIDQSQMALNGYAVKINWPRTGQEFPGNTQTRVASGGVPGYTYASSNPTVASVNATTGLVIGNRNGSAVITATDRNGTSRQYAVAVSNVYELLVNETAQIRQAQINWMNSVRGIPFSIFRINSVYNPPTRRTAYGMCYVSVPDWYNFIGAGSGPLIHFGGRAEYILPAWCLRLL
ncbi:Ig-like domain-containing protein [Pseudomonas sp. Bout1]|uniref:Ig-like domain-containing protein n=1 Tax=Pseudomonas sp. Bout1 TaxID=3048600 RepID=UPI002AB5B1AC|nr:Ig-like domain-containing protein [Pseudomonas sp. Bout1]MDY7533686.1 Ig-like domain-containing protein [Pseudomonas sp. Bout1]MEB0186056.1 Ig-like domain-containing protein [Pseudomonas sp. Bout1]